jgi:predicted AAA+ superfamily ATPase
MYLFNSWYKIFLSWSNSKLLSSELSTIFRWRTIDIKIFPLNFWEFLYFKNIEKKNFYTENDVWLLKNLIQEFLDFWSYPEIVLSKNKETKYELIKSYFTLLLYKDLLERYWIENEYVIKYLIKKLLLSTTKEFNINKVFNEIKSQNIKIWKQTIYNYLEYLKEIFFIKEVSDEFKKGSKKFFFYDVWYNNITLLENLWQRFENIIFSELNRRFENVIYRKNNSYEIDFIILEKSIAIQICYDLNTDNLNREIKCFSESNFKNNYLVYFNKQKDFEVKWLRIVNILEFVELIKK